jgi:hypothetical protein
MKEDDLDHLGAMHQAIARSGKARRLFRRLFRLHK